MSKLRSVLGPEWGRGVVGLLRTRHSPLPLVGVAIVVYVIFTVAAPNVFPTGGNMQAMGFAMPEVGILGLAVMFSMLIAGMDLSVVGVANLSSVAIAEAALHVHFLAGGGWGVVILDAIIAMVVGGACGAVNGALISLVGFGDIIATLATGYLFLGLALGITRGAVLSKLPPDLATLGIARVGGVPVIFLVFLAVAIVMGVVLNRTRLGLRAMLIGTNVTAARLSGVRRPQVVMGTYVVCGVLAGLAGVIFTGRVAGVNGTYGSSYVLLAVLIAILGGVDPTGGFASVLGVVLATVILQMVQSGFTALNLSQFTYEVAQGALVVAVLAANVWRKNGGSLRGVLHRRRPSRNDKAAPPGEGDVQPVIQE
jgi:simple sugar transport system permease protein